MCDVARIDHVTEMPVSNLGVVIFCHADEEAARVVYRSKDQIQSDLLRTPYISYHFNFGTCSWMKHAAEERLEVKA